MYITMMMMDLDDDDDDGWWLQFKAMSGDHYVHRDDDDGSLLG